LDVASHQSRFVAVEASRARLNFRLPWIRAFNPETDVSRAEWNSLMLLVVWYESGEINGKNRARSDCR
jgi:hypothetical protein